jgi:hypothetical protein
LSKLPANAGGLLKNAQLLFICGRDAAERIVAWDYGEPDAFRRMLDQFELLVAARTASEPPLKSATASGRSKSP